MGDDGQNGRVVEKARKEPDVKRGVLVIRSTEDGKTFRYSARQIGQAIERGTVFQRLVRAVQPATYNNNINTRAGGRRRRGFIYNDDDYYHSGNHKIAIIMSR
jgi:hypothetical protein